MGASEQRTYRERQRASIYGAFPGFHWQHLQPSFRSKRKGYFYIKCRQAPECSPKCLILGGEKIPTNFEFICASFGWLGAFFEKDFWSKRSIFTRTVKWTLRAHFWVFLSKNSPTASFDVCAHIPSGCNTISCQICPPTCHIFSKWLKLAQIRHFGEHSGVL